MNTSWRDFVKSAGVISKDGKTFVLNKGMSPWHVAKEWKMAHPESSIGVSQIASMISSANPGVKPAGYRPGKAYNMPQFPVANGAPAHQKPAKTMAPPAKASPVGTETRNVGAYGGVNNMFNMRHYNQKWLGEITTGLNKGDMLGFETPWHGFRAGSRNVRRIMDRLVSQRKKRTIRNFTPIFSPEIENDVKRHMGNISSFSGIGLDDEIDVNNNDQMYKLLTGLARAESGKSSLNGLSRDRIMDAIRSSKKSM